MRSPVHPPPGQRFPPACREVFQHFQVSLDDGDGRPQFVAGVLEEFFLALEGDLKAIEHFVKSGCQFGDLVFFLDRQALVHSINKPGYIYGRYKCFGDTEMDASFFPVLWTKSGYRTPLLEAYCDDALMG